MLAADENKTNEADDGQGDEITSQAEPDQANAPQVQPGEEHEQEAEKEGDEPPPPHVPVMLCEAFHSSLDERSFTDCS